MEVKVHPKHTRKIEDDLRFYQKKCAEVEEAVRVANIVLRDYVASLKQFQNPGVEKLYTLAYNYQAASKEEKKAALDYLTDTFGDMDWELTNTEIKDISEGSVFVTARLGKARFDLRIPNYQRLTPENIEDAAFGRFQVRIHPRGKIQQAHLLFESFCIEDVKAFLYYDLADAYLRAVSENN